MGADSGEERDERCVLEMWSCSSAAFVMLAAAATNALLRFIHKYWRYAQCQTLDILNKQEADAKQLL